jgi:hypothetical protein
VGAVRLWLRIAIVFTGAGFLVATLVGLAP